MPSENNNALNGWIPDNLCSIIDVKEFSLEYTKLIDNDEIYNIIEHKIEQKTTKLVPLRTIAMSTFYIIQRIGPTEENTNIHDYCNLEEKCIERIEKILYVENIEEQHKNILIQSKKN